MIKQGDTEFFAIDAKSGVLKTLRGLDYERDNQHILIVGTQENNNGEKKGSTTRVIVNVQVNKYNGFVVILLLTGFYNNYCRTF